LSDAVIALGFALAAAALWFLLRHERRLGTRFEALEKTLAEAQTRPTAMAAPTPAVQSLPSGLQAGNQAPLFTLPDVYGVQQSLSALRGHALLLIFFDPECRFCQDFAPELARLMMTRAPHDPFPIVVSTGSLAANQKLVSDHGLSCPVLLQQALEVATAYRASATPMGYRIDANGRIASQLAVGLEELLALASGAASSAPSDAKASTLSAASASTPALPGLEVGVEAPAFTLRDLKGAARSLADWRGQRLLLVFFNPHVAPCLELAPALARWSVASERMDPMPVIITSSGQAANERAALDHNILCPILLQEGMEVFATYSVTGTPMACLVDDQGRIDSPLAIGPVAILSCVAAVQAETSEAAKAAASGLNPSASAVSSAQSILCRVDEAPFGYATRRVYSKQGIRFVKGDGPWQIYRPQWNAVRDALPASLGDTSGKWIEAIPGIDLLATRRPLWRKLVEMLGTEGAARIMSETFVLSSEEDLQRLASSDPSERFVLKGAQQRRKGIRLASGQEAVKLKDEFLVAERFVADQYRYRDTTFHLRCYLLLTLQQGTLTTWLFEDTICGWALPSTQAKDEFQEWITHPDNAVPDDYPCSMSELCAALGLDFEACWAGIAAHVSTMVRCCSGGVGKVAQLNDAICFQHFGVDVILKTDGTLRVCEINALPEMDAQNPRYAAIKDRVLRDGLVVAGIISADAHGFRKVL
jgi:peroxiredoxin